MKDYNLSYEAFKTAYENCEKTAKEKQTEKDCKDCSVCLNVRCRKWIKNLAK